MIEVFTLPVYRRLVVTLVHFLWQGAAVALCLRVSFTLLSRAQTRYALSLAALLFMASCPVVTFLSLGGGESPEMARSGVGLAFTSFVFDADFSASHLRDYAREAQPYVILCWLTGVLGLGLRLVAGQVGTLWLRRSTQCVPHELERRARILAERLGLRGRWRLAATCRIDSAVAVGLWRPVVLIPASWLTGFPTDLLDAVVAHELAHIRRWDLWANLLQRLLETAFFYNPFVWWVSRCVTQEREMCCDELAATATHGRETYVLALETAAKVSAGLRAPALGTALAERSKMNLLKRVKYLLAGPGIVRESRWWPIGLLTTTLPLMAWLLSLGLLTAGVPSVSAEEHSPKDKEVLRLVRELREEVRQLRREVNKMRERNEGPEHHGGEEHEGREHAEREKNEGREHHDREERRNGNDKDGGERHEREEREGRKHHDGADGDGEHRERKEREGREHHGREGRKGAEHAERAGRLFKGYDSNGDTRVSKDEFFQKLIGKNGKGMDREKLERLFRSGDKDGNGSWSLEEFAAKLRRGEHHE
ncbi:MAG: EF-hand domain-containing protein [Lentisphaeria bacterium]|nr:EF-hand domain-containing protein [Lentisphaeria bacterium]